MRRPIIDIKYTKDRRNRLKKMAGGNKAFIFFSGKAPRRSNDTNYKFRVNSNFFYLTGFEEEDAVFVYRPGQTPETVMFVHPKDPLLETWEGFLYGVELTKEHFKVDEVYSNKDFDSKISELLMDSEDVYYKMGVNEAEDARVLKATKEVLRKKGRKGHPMQNIKDPDEYLAELRMVKTEEEIALMKKTCQISAEAHIEVIKSTKPGVTERYLEGVFLSSVIKHGAVGPSYNSILAAGPNATTLHYVFNDAECKEGDLLLIDAGSEYQYYAGDITRTYPIGKKFSDAQRSLYQGILDVQKKLINMVKPGCTFKSLNEFSAKSLIQVMIDHGLLSGSVEENYESAAFKKYYPHGVGHFLGIDVHDIGYYEKDNEPVEFEPGMMLTIEPGIYVPHDDKSAPEHLRGIGIRIEDDILVTNEGADVMTSLVPKEISELEALKA